MSSERDPQSDAAALKRAALQMAIEHHGHSSRHPKSNGAAAPTTVTATADTFLQWLRETVDRSGVELPEPRDTQGPPPRTSGGP